MIGKNICTRDLVSTYPIGELGPSVPMIPHEEGPDPIWRVTQVKGKLPGASFPNHTQRLVMAICRANLRVQAGLKASCYVSQGQRRKGGGRDGDGGGWLA